MSTPTLMVVGERLLLMRSRQTAQGEVLQMAELPSQLNWIPVGSAIEVRSEVSAEEFASRFGPQWASVERELAELIPQPDGAVHTSTDGATVGWWSFAGPNQLALSLVLDASVGPLGAVDR